MKPSNTSKPTDDAVPAASELPAALVVEHAVGPWITGWEISLGDPDIEWGISWFHEKLMMGSPDSYYRRMDPLNDRVWIKRDGQHIYQARRWEDPEWKCMLGFLRETMRHFPQREDFLGEFEKVLMQDAKLYGESSVGMNVPAWSR